MKSKIQTTNELENLLNKIIGDANIHGFEYSGIYSIKLTPLSSELSHFFNEIVIDILQHFKLEEKIVNDAKVGEEYNKVIQIMKTFALDVVRIKVLSNMDLRIYLSDDSTFLIQSKSEDNRDIVDRSWNIYAKNNLNENIIDILCTPEKDVFVDISDEILRTLNDSVSTVGNGAK